MRTYTVTEYDIQDYDDYENNVTLTEIINNLKHIKRGYIVDYNFTGEEDDFEKFKLHVSLYKAIKILTEMMEVETNQRKEDDEK